MRNTVCIVLVAGTAACNSSSSTSGDATKPGDGRLADAGSGTTQTRFPASSTIYADISGSPVDPAWNAILGGALSGGFGSAFQLDPSFVINVADPSVPHRTFTQTSTLVDCDPAPMPVPPGGHVEGEPDYHCTDPTADCHLLIFQGTRLYEAWQGDITGGQSTGGTFTATCGSVWDLTRDYWQTGTPYSRGEGCTGADAADMPIAPLLITKSEIAAHQIDHAMRFTIVNPKIDGTYYVHPATHLGGSGPSGTTLPYGARLRLKASYDVTTIADLGARAIAVALQKYGMFMDDGGHFFVSATQDITDVIDTHALKALVASDFEMVDGGTRINFHQQTCAHTPITN